MKVTTTGEPWRVLLIESRQSRLALLQSVRRIAVIGIKTAESGGPAYDVPASLQACVTSEAAGWTFPSPGAPVSFELPLQFRPR